MSGEQADDLVVHRPPTALQDYISTVHGYRYDPGASQDHRGLPSSALTVVLSFEQPLDVAWLSRPDTRSRLWATASGLSARPAVIHQCGPQLGIQLDVTPAGSRALFGCPASALADGLLDLCDLTGRFGADLYDDVASALSWPRRFTTLDRHLIRLLSEHGPGPERSCEPETIWAWNVLTDMGSPRSVQSVADDLGWSRRHLTGRFIAEYGIGPKVAARIARFQRSVALVRSYEMPSLADVSYACGYADQSHLTREWQQLAGYSPTQWRRAEFPFLQDRRERALAASSS